jgi:16S rRNA processing protein RimM
MADINPRGKLTDKLADESTDKLTGWLELGTIVAAQGLKGEVRVYPESDFPERFECPGQRWLLHPGRTQPEPIELLQGRYLNNKGLYVVKFAGIDQREQAESLKNCRVLVPESDRPVLAPDEFHLEDLIGLTVVNQQTQAVIGVVIGVAVAGNDLLEVRLNDGTQALVLIPLVREIVPLIDLQQRRVEIVPLPGLLP